MSSFSKLKKFNIFTKIIHKINDENNFLILSDLENIYPSKDELLCRNYWFINGYNYSFIGRGNLDCILTGSIKDEFKMIIVKDIYNINNDDLFLLNK